MRYIPLHLLLQKQNDGLIVFRSVGKGAVSTAFDHFVFLLHHTIIPRAVMFIQRAIAEKAVELRITAVTWIVLTIFV